MYTYFLKQVTDILKQDKNNHVSIMAMAENHASTSTVRCVWGEVANSNGRHISSVHMLRLKGVVAGKIWC